MNYQDELSAKLAAVRPTLEVEKTTTVTTSSLEEKILSELDDEFEFARYDLEESDILRTLKILEILNTYEKVFTKSQSLKIFYTIARVDIITPKNLHSFIGMSIKEFKVVLANLYKAKLIIQNEHNELELSDDGKSLASRLGIYIF